MPHPTTKRGVKTPLDWAIFALVILNLVLSGFWAYKEINNLTTHPVWYIHLILATFFIAVLITRARRQLAGQTDQQPDDPNLTAPES